MRQPEPARHGEATSEARRGDQRGMARRPAKHGAATSALVARAAAQGGDLFCAGQIMERIMRSSTSAASSGDGTATFVTSDALNAS